VGGPVLTSASLHLAACTPNFKIQENFNDFADEEVKQAAPGLPEVVDGYFALPPSPGLGVRLDVDFVAEHPPHGAHFDLYAGDWHFRGQQQGSS
jgi:galactonate dehydratase